MMTDHEWDHWHQLWAGYDSPLPAIERSARRESLVKRASAATFWVIVAGEVVYAIRGLKSGWPLTGRIAAVIVLVAAVFLAAIYIDFQRRTWKRATATPLEVLAGMERLVAEQARLAMVVRWFGVVACFATAALTAWDAWRMPERWNIRVAVWCFAAVLAVFFWWVPIRVARRHKRRLEQIEFWRRQLDDGPTGADGAGPTL